MKMVFYILLISGLSLAQIGCFTELGKTDRTGTDNTTVIERVWIPEDGGWF